VATHAVRRAIAPQGSGYSRPHTPDVVPT
jgi:hypothetical protein